MHLMDDDASIQIGDQKKIKEHLLSLKINKLHLYNDDFHFSHTWLTLHTKKQQIYSTTKKNSYLIIINKHGWLHTHMWSNFMLLMCVFCTYP